MKRGFAVAMTMWFLLGASIAAMAQVAASQPSKATADVIKMAAAGIGDDVLLSFVQSSKAPFHLGADDIIALKDAKVGAAVILAMLDHDATGAVSSGTSITTTTTRPALNPDPNATPEPLIETVPVAPGPGFAWVPGYWSWNGSAWIWIYGVWRPPVYFGWHRRGRW